MAWTQSHLFHHLAKSRVIAVTLHCDIPLHSRLFTPHSTMLYLPSTHIKEYKQNMSVITV